MKRFLYLLIGLVVFSCTTDYDLIDDQGVENSDPVSDHQIKSSNPVSLVKAGAFYMRFRGFRSYRREFVVKVANLSYEKKVSIYHEKVDGSWKELPMQYKESIDGTTELWHLFNISYGGKSYADEFVIKYEVNGETYWDNNNGNNYRMDDADGFLFGDPDLAVSVDQRKLSFFTNSEGNKQLNVIADVRNIAPVKEVDVVYTTDGWSTVHHASMEFRQYWSGSFDDVETVSPNQHGIERWTSNVILPENVEYVDFAVVYKVNGQEYWDNNYGKNFTTKR